MRRKRLDLLGKLLVHFVHAEFFFVLLLVVERGGNRALFEYEFAQRLSRFGVVGNALGDNVFRARDRVLRSGYALFFVDVLGGKRENIALLLFLRENNIGKRLESAFDRDRSAGLFLLFVRAVDILYFGKRHRFIERGGEFVRPLALTLDGSADFFLALVEVFEISQSV